MLCVKLPLKGKPGVLWQIFFCIIQLLGCFFCLFLCLTNFLFLTRICRTLGMSRCSFLLRLLTPIKLEPAVSFLLLSFSRVRRTISCCSAAFFFLCPVRGLLLLPKRESSGISTGTAKRCSSSCRFVLLIRMLECLPFSSVKSPLPALLPPQLLPQLAVRVLHTG